MCAANADTDVNKDAQNVDTNADTNADANAKSLMPPAEVMTHMQTTADTFYMPQSSAFSSRLIVV